MDPNIVILRSENAGKYAERMLRLYGVVSCDAQDVIQSLVKRFLEKPRTFRDESERRGYLWTCIRNQVISETRQQRPANELQDHQVSDPKERGIRVGQIIASAFEAIRSDTSLTEDEKAVFELILEHRFEQSQARKRIIKEKIDALLLEMNHSGVQRKGERKSKPVPRTFQRWLKDFLEYIRPIIEKHINQLDIHGDIEL